MPRNPDRNQRPIVYLSLSLEPIEAILKALAADHAGTVPPRYVETTYEQFAKARVRITGLPTPIYPAVWSKNS